MSNGPCAIESADAGDVTVLFGERFQASQKFDQVFQQGMGLVEEAAAYLDGAGRKDAKALTGTVVVLYATESMRLTTRLLDLASWLLIRRALKEGEISPEDARKKRNRVKLQSVGRPQHTKGYEDLPEGLRNLIEASFALHDRIVQLDRAMAMDKAENAEAEAAMTPVNPVNQQMSRLRQAFRS